MQNIENNSTGKKRIMLVVPMLDQGGLERVCALTGQLLKDTYDVYIAVFNSTGMIYDISEITLIDLQLGAVSGKLGKIFNVIKRSIRLNQICREKGIHIVYSFGRTANIACANIRTSVKKIGACHSHKEIKNIKYLKFLNRKMDMIFCCSKAMAHEVSESVCTKKVLPVWNPCDIEGIQQLAKEDITNYDQFFETHAKIIVAMGREDDVKGYWHLVKAFKKICEKQDNIGLVIIGNGEFLEYKQMAKDLGIDSDILFTGVQVNPFCYLAKCDVLVLSSLSEGLPNTLVEAMAVGVPIVSVNCQSGPAEILEEDWQSVDTIQNNYYAEYGILTPPFSGEKDLQCEVINGEIQLSVQEKLLVDGIEEIINNENLAKKYSQSGLRRCNDFSKEAYQKMVIESIEQLVGV